MVPTRRGALQTLGGAMAIALAGCIGDESSDDGADASPTATAPPPTETAAPNPTSPHADPTRTTRYHASQRVSYDHVVRIDNDRESARTVSLRIEAADGTVVHEGTYDLDAYEAREAFDFSTLASDARRSYTVRATHDGATEVVTVSMTECYGDVIVAFSPEAGFFLTYSVC